MAEGINLLAINVPPNWNELRGRIFEDATRRYLEIREGKRIYSAQVVNIFSEAMMRTGQISIDERILRGLGLGEYIVYTNRSEYISELDKIVYELYEKNRIYVDDKPVYWCESCKTALTSNEVKRVVAEKDYVFGKIKIEEDTFFVISDVPEKFEDTYGIILNSRRNYVSFNLRGKKIICDMKEWEEIKIKVGLEDTEIFSTITYGQILGIAKDVYIFVSDTLPTQVLTPFLNRRHYDLVKKFNIPLKKIEVDTFSAGKRRGYRYFCRFCDGEVKVKRHHEVYISARGIPKPAWLGEKHYEDVMISSNHELLPKMPILFCDKCGRWEFGHREKVCECNDRMRKVFSYNENLLRSLSQRNGLDKIYVTYPEILWHIYISYLIMKSLEEEWFRELKIIGTIRDESIKKFAEIYPPEILRLAILSTRGEVTLSTIKRAWKFFNTLINIYRYFRVYQKEREVIENTDTWILSVLQKIKKSYLELLSKDKFADAFNLLYNFVVKDLAGFYIRVIRGDKGSLELVLPDLIRMAYIYLPETSKRLMEELHVTSEKLEVREDMIYEGLESEIKSIRDTIQKINNLRREKNIPFRKPLTKVVIVVTEEKLERVRVYRDVIMKLCNVMDVEVVTEWGELHFDIIPNMEAFSEAYKPWASKIAMVLRSRDVSKVKKEIERGGYVVGIEGQAIRITPNMVKFVSRIPDGYVSLSSSIGDLYVDIRSNELVEKEYVVREFIRRIQNMKKDINVDYDDVIDVFIDCPPEYRAFLEEMHDNVSKIVRARKIVFARNIEVGYVVEWGVISKTATIGIVPLNKKKVLKAFTKLPDITEDVAVRLFDAGICSIPELMNSDPDEIGSIEGLSRAIIRKAVDYLRKNSPFEKISRENKFYCPLCESELSEEDIAGCAVCGTPLGTTAESKEEKKEVKKEESEITPEKELYLEFGKGYILLDKFDIAYKKIAEYAYGGEKVLCITQMKPSEVISKYKLPKSIRITWISNSSEKGAVKPRDLEKLSLVIDGFLAEGGKIIMIDGVEFLISQNDFFAVLRFLQILRDDIRVENGLLLFPISSKSFPEPKLNLLKREFTII